MVLKQVIARVCHASTWLVRKKKYSSPMNNFKDNAIHYCLNTIFQKLHFSKSHFSERPQEEYEHVTILHSKSLKKCHKNFENRLTNENFMQENIFE